MTKKIVRQAVRVADDRSDVVAMPSRKQTAKSNEAEKKIIGLSAACNLLIVLLIVLWIVADIQKDAICKNLLLESLRPDIAQTCNQNPLQFLMGILARL